MVDRVPTIDEIDSREKLEAYLKTRPAQEARAIALKAAWRVMPMLSRAILVDSCDEAAKKKLVSYVFYANFLSLARVGFKVQTHSNLELPQIVSDTSDLFPPNLCVPATAAAYAFSCIFNGDVDRIKLDAVGCIEASTRAISPQEVYWEVVRGDLRLIRSVILRRAFNIGFWPSWSPDAWIEESEQRFRDSLLTLGADWEVIWSFYRRVMKVGANPLFSSGGYFKAIAELAKEDARFWERDPDAVMREISERLRDELNELEFNGDTTLDHVAQQLVQTPADFRFSAINDEPIEAIPFRDVASNRHFAETTLAEAIEKAQEFLERLERANADPQVKRSVERLLRVLPQQFEALNPALMRSKTRTLEANASAYISAGAEAELFPNAVADLQDLVLTLRDLQGCFPSIAEVERNTVAIDIAGREQEVEQALSAITESARELSANYPSMITAAAVDAVGILDDDIADAPNLDVKRNLLAGSALIKHNFLSAVYRKLLAEARSVGKRHYDTLIDESVGVTRKTVGTFLPLVYFGGFDWRAAALIAFFPELFKGVKQAKQLIERLAKE